MFLEWQVPRTFHSWIPGPFSRAKRYGASSWRRAMGFTLIAFGCLAPVSAVEPSSNPLLTESSLPYHYPPFDRIRADDFAPAIEQGVAEQLGEVEAIASSNQAPSFENTIVALERSGRLLDRTLRIFFALNAANTSPQLQGIALSLAPRLAAHQDSILLNAALFARIDQLYEDRKTLGLDPESQRLLWRYQKDFARAGANLPTLSQVRLRLLNADIATLQTTFSQNTLHERDASSVLFDSSEKLKGLSDSEIAAAAAAAKTAGKAGKFLLKLVNTSGQPLLAKLQNRDSRERLMAASLARGSRGGDFDNRAVVAAIARKRAERAALLGYADHATYRLEDQTVGSVERLNKILARLAPPTVVSVTRHIAELQALVDAESAGSTLSAADWNHYGEKLRLTRYGIDTTQLKPYYELDHVLLDGVFYAATRFFGLSFKERYDLPVYEPTVRVFDVWNEDGSALAIFIFDPYSRPNKDGGAWMKSYVLQSSLLGSLPVVANHLNIPKPPPGEPTLLTQDEVTTAFHEFGHALHGMFSRVRYPRFSGLAVPSDFVEYPSQVNEMWATWPEVLEHYARHYQTGEPMPQSLRDRVMASVEFDKNFSMAEYLAATLLDQAWHQAGAASLPDADEVVSFETAALNRVGLDFTAVPARYRSTYFLHSFAGGYAGGYYSYIWSEILDADSVEWIKVHGGITRANGDHFRKTVLSRGGSDDAFQLFHDFTGHDPDLRLLLIRRGLQAPGAAALLQTP